MVYKARSLRDPGHRFRVETNGSPTSKVQNSELLARGYEARASNVYIFVAWRQTWLTGMVDRHG